MTGFIRGVAVLVMIGFAVVSRATDRTVIRDLDDMPYSSNTKLGWVLVTDFPATGPPPIPESPFATCVRDHDNNPVPFSTVTVDFSTCGMTVEVAPAQDQNTTVNCGSESVSMTADAAGCVVLGPFIARTSIAVSGWPTPPGNMPARNIGPAEPVVCVAVYAGSFLLGTGTVRINRYDSDVDGDVDAGDRGYTLDAVGHFFGTPPPSPPYRMFYDYDHDGDVDAGDVAAVLDAEARYLTGQATPYAGPYCP